MHKRLLFDTLSLSDIYLKYTRKQDVCPSDYSAQSAHGLVLPQFYKSDYTLQRRETSSAFSPLHSHHLHRRFTKSLRIEILRQEKMSSPQSLVVRQPILNPDIERSDRIQPELNPIGKPPGHDNFDGIGWNQDIQIEVRWTEVAQEENIKVMVYWRINPIQPPPEFDASSPYSVPSVTQFQPRHLAADAFHESLTHWIDVQQSAKKLGNKAKIQFRVCLGESMPPMKKFWRSVHVAWRVEQDDANQNGIWNEAYLTTPGYVHGNAFEGPSALGRIRE